ncbi:hypothetical protein ACP4OV_001400 [Aristida adscensionis]
MPSSEGGGGEGGARSRCARSPRTSRTRSCSACPPCPPATTSAPSSPPRASSATTARGTGTPAFCLRSSPSPFAQTAGSRAAFHSADPPHLPAVARVPSPLPTCPSGSSRRASSWAAATESEEEEEAAAAKSRGLGGVLDYIREDPIGLTIHPASLSPPALPSGAGDDDGDHPSWVLLDIRAYIADRPNATTAVSFTRAHHEIRASLCIARPPCVSYLCVHWPALAPADFVAEPRVLASASDLVLFQAVVCNPIVAFEDAMQDLFIYHAAPPEEEPSLTLLPHHGDLPCHLTAYKYNVAFS